MRKKTVVTSVLAMVIALGLAFSVMLGNVQTYAAMGTVYDSFDDYDTTYDRDGLAGGVYDQILEWSGAPMACTAEAGNPVGTTEGKSLKITQKSNTMIIAWGNGTKDSDKLNQTGAKYVKYYVRNLSGVDKNMSIIVTDVLQSTVDSFATAGNTIPDAGQEHWIIGWNQPVLLTTITGEKNIAYSVNGNYYSIPRDFEGTVSVPLSNLVRPDWWLQEGHAYANGVLDLERVFLTSFCIPQATNISIEDESTWTIFEIDNVTFGSDDEVETYIQENGKGGSDAAKSVVVLKDGTGVSVDFATLIVSAKVGITRGELADCFDLTGVTMRVKDEYGFVKTSATDVLANDYTIEFIKDGDTYTFKLQCNEDGNNKENNGGCGSVIAMSGVGSLTLVGAAVVAFRRKKEK